MRIRCSAFKNFIQKEYYDINWGNFEDKYNIKELILNNF